MYKASVIVPVYNAEKTLVRCVESLLFGKERDLEVILVEDRSRDGSWAVCQALARQYENVTALQNEKNSGVSFTRNRGLEAAKGRYILFCDSDDWVSGDYARSLLAGAEQTDTLSLCGFHFLDHGRNARQAYVWESGCGAEVILPVERAFALMDKVLLQSACAKAFSGDIIRQRHLRFREDQTMGEDTQFVLDYIQAAGIRQFRVLDAALYYYIRTGGSLMGNFGLVEQEQAYARLEQLRQITGDPARYLEAVAALGNTLAYQVMRSTTLSQKEKLAFAEKTLGKKHGRRFFCKQGVLLVRERLAALLKKGKTVWLRLRGKGKSLCRKRRTDRLRRTLQAEGFTVLSQNCVGGVLYHDMGMQFLSPTVDLYFSAADFLKLAQKPRFYLTMEPVMAWDEEYPVGMLGDIQVRFMHACSCTEAKAAWLRRAQRVNYQKIAVLCSDREGFTQEVFAQWQQLTLPKLLFTANPRYAQDPDSLFYPEYARLGAVPNLIPNREFYKDQKLIRLLNTFTQTPA